MRLVLRILYLIFPVTFGFAGLDVARASEYAAPYVLACANCVASSDAHESSMTGPGHHAVEALVSRPAPVQDQGRDDTGGAKRRIGSQGNRPGLAGDASLEAQARAASRARHIARSSLAFAADLARARAGIVISRSNAPPPTSLG